MSKTMIFTVILVGAAAAIGLASYYFLGADNAIEEEAEKIIKDETGLNIDLSPGSPEVTTKS
jgi:hypothetical protein